MSNNVSLIFNPEEPPVINAEEEENFVIQHSGLDSEFVRNWLNDYYVQACVVEDPSPEAFILSVNDMHTQSLLWRLFDSQTEFLISKGIAERE